MSTSTEPSLSVATVPRKAMVFGFGTKLIISRFPVSDDESPSPYNSTIVEDGQIVRAVSFLRIPDGPLCVVTAGDGKMINVYNVSSDKAANPHAQDSSDEEEDEAKKHQTFVTHLSKPSFSYGPHTKRITSLATGEDGSVIFADKFGEVFRLRLSFSPQHTIEVSGDLKAPAVSLLQHLSTLSTLYLSAPVPRLEDVSMTEDVRNVEPRRLFTCDKDRHARVSRYPETYSIEQFLWAKRGHQSVVTCLTEVPSLCDGDTDAPTAATSGHKTANKRNRRHNAPYCYYVSGEASGRVCFWAARNDVLDGDPAPSFHLISSFAAGSGGQGDHRAALQAPSGAEGQPVVEDNTKAYGSVVSVTYVVLNRTELCALHPRDYVRGILVAYEKSSELLYLPLYNMGEYGLHVSAAHQERIPLPRPPVALASTSDSNAVALLRDGSLTFVGLVQKPDADRTDEEKKICSVCSNISASPKVLPWRMPYLEQRIKSVMCQPAGGAAGGQTQLEALDLCAHWKLEPSDPRNRERDSDEDNEAEATEEPDAGKGAKGRRKRRSDTPLFRFLHQLFYC
ncbi:hypothetical protein STCU_01029 [Strigomonas culicis]|uniref:Uncharacterized protein n=1 Tax=Strigomonas culicis TaxID=28005 RepID=S9WIG4_9TRYP|nr:hypothetical protein STCU_01029 [Strigomonas culicis]|eukprot:EPY35645.1 hypothetical protein STCU_01029 [Strigomonas culicis]